MTSMIDTAPHAAACAAEEAGTASGPVPTPGTERDTHGGLPDASLASAPSDAPSGTVPPEAPSGTRRTIRRRRRTARTAVPAGVGDGDGGSGSGRALLRDDSGMSTVEYAIGTVAAAAFAAILYAVVSGDSILTALTDIVQRALSTTF